MHPLLTRGRFGLYLLGWIPLAAILVYILAAGGQFRWIESVLLVVPLCVVYSFICLAAWYPVKSAPLDRTPMVRLTLRHALAATILSLLWIQLAKGLAYLLSRSSSFPNLSQRVSSELPILFGAGFLLYLLAVASHYVIFSLEASREAQGRVMQSSILTRDAELKALKAQVNPHFLFNSLNSVSALTSIDPERAREMCILLADFLRMTLGLGEKSSIPLGEELQLLERFIAIEKVRFGSRLNMEEEIQLESKALFIPPLLLQPLIENAVGHGIANLLDGGTIRLAARRTDRILVISIENSFDPDATVTRQGGRGLLNVRRRLEARYGAAASLNAKADGHRFCVELMLPAETEEAKP